MKTCIILNIWWVIATVCWIYNKNDQNIKGFDIKSLEGKTIGVFAKATDKIKRLNNVLEFNDIKSDIKYYGTSDEFESSLDNGEVDLLLVSDLFNKLADYNVALRFNSEPCYIGCQEGRSGDKCAAEWSYKKIQLQSIRILGEACFKNIFLLITVTLLYSQNRKVRLYIKMAHLR